MLTQIVLWLNSFATSMASIVLAPIAWLPGWLSATLIAVVTGIVMLIVFKYTSNQVALKQTRNQIKANLLALSLFKEELRVCLRAQVSLLWQAGRLLLLSLKSVLVMTVPMGLALGQLGLWYQARPVTVGEETIVTVHLAAAATDAIRQIQLNPHPAVRVTIGPVRVFAKNMVCWNIQTAEPGRQTLTFRIGEQEFTKELAIGQGFMPVSLSRPSMDISAMLLHPREQPFERNSLVQSIDVTYPKRNSWTCGSDWWMLYWFVVSMIVAFVARPVLKVAL